MKDSEILDLLKTGKQHKAIQKLYAYYPVIRKMVLRNNGSKQDAEDVYQEALIVFCKNAVDGQFELKSSINTYLYSVCRYIWNDELKKKGKRFESELNEEISSTTEHEIEEAVVHEKSLHLAEKAFLQLGEKCKELLQLFYFKKLSMKEIATRLKFSSEKVAKNQKYRCIEKAKENLKMLEI